MPSDDSEGYSSVGVPDESLVAAAGHGDNEERVSQVQSIGSSTNDDSFGMGEQPSITAVTPGASAPTMDCRQAPYSSYDFGSDTHFSIRFFDIINQDVLETDDDVKVVKWNGHFYDKEGLAQCFAMSLEQEFKKIRKEHHNQISNARMESPPHANPTPFKRQPKVCDPWMQRWEPSGLSELGIEDFPMVENTRSIDDHVWHMWILDTFGYSVVELKAQKWTQQEAVEYEEGFQHYVCRREERETWKSNHAAEAAAIERYVQGMTSAMQPNNGQSDSTATSIEIANEAPQPSNNEMVRSSLGNRPNQCRQQKKTLDFLSSDTHQETALYELLMEAKRGDPSVTDGTNSFGSTIAGGKRGRWFKKMAPVWFDREQSGFLSMFRPTNGETLQRKFGAAEQASHARYLQKGHDNNPSGATDEQPSRTEALFWEYFAAYTDGVSSSAINAPQRLLDLRNIERETIGVMAPLGLDGAVVTQNRTETSANASRLTAGPISRNPSASRTVVSTIDAAIQVARGSESVSEDPRCPRTLNIGRSGLLFGDTGEFNTSATGLLSAHQQSMKDLVDRLVSVSASPLQHPPPPQQMQLSFIEAVNERTSVKRALDELSESDENSEIRSLLKRRIKVLEKRMRETVDDHGTEEKENQAEENEEMI